MSIEAMMWALNLAPVPSDKSKPNAACAAVLIGLANHAGPDGEAAFPAIETLVRYTRLSRRTVITALDRLLDEGIVTACDPDVIAAKIKRADRRPKGYDLQMDRHRDDLSRDELLAIQRANPLLRHAVQAMLDGMQPLHPVDEARDAASDVRGATNATRGATTAERGAAAAPEPTKNPPEPSESTTTTSSSARGTRLPEDWQPDESMREWYRQQPFATTGVINPVVESEKFRDYWIAQPGAKGTKLDWPATWRNWMRTAAERAAPRRQGPQHPPVDPQHSSSRDNLW